MNCEQVRESALDSLDGPMGAGPRLLMEKHVATCDACRRFTELQQRIDARLTAAVPVASLSPGFRRSLQQKIDASAASSWSESLPDIAHLAGCALAILVLLLVLPQYSRTLLVTGAGFTTVTYFLQAVLRTSLETLDDRL